MTTVHSIVSAAVRQLGITNLQSSKLSQCREALNVMLIDWATAPSGIYQATRESFSVVSGTDTYTMGSGGDFDTVRPVRIIKAFVRSDQTDYRVKVLALENYADIPLKAKGNRPYSLYHERGVALDTLIVYPVPDETYTLHLWSHKPLGSYSSLDDTLALPPEYEPAIKYNLALVVAPELAVQPYPSTVAMATRAYKALRNLNMSPIPVINTNIFSGRRSGVYETTDPSSTFSV